ncbi:MAG: Nucleoside triphosphate pyrophosphohydrolase/pyrophosphatase MazG [Elusimicrobia bacterium]|nr:Nucleoside triphosphate pyrophosphohydrolase/pyrophosphatase MazG [Elusimicrobiota bacterium]
MAQLRSKSGCPWDREQTHISLVKYLREETKELEQAIRKKDMANLEEELGDVLLQILFHSQIASEKNLFDIEDVIQTLTTKLTLRHPHVFGDKKHEKWTAQDVVARWDEIKQREKEIRRKMRRKR